MSANSILETLQQNFQSHIHQLQVLHHNEIHCELGCAEWLPKVCLFAHNEWQAQFVCGWASDERTGLGKFFIHFLFSLDREKLFLAIKAPVDGSQPEYPALSEKLIAANWAEREICDTFGITPIGHPNLKTLWSHPDWPDNNYPMRRDFPKDQMPERFDGDFPFQKVLGEGVFEIPVGPIHAGIIEPGHFRFSVAGEPIIRLQLQLFYTHKGIEKLCEGLPAERVVHISERISGDSTFAHSLSFCQAIERICGVEIPARAQAIRMLALELERLHNHFNDIGMIANDVAYLVGYAHSMIIREDFLKLNEKLCGSRLLRGLNDIGGVRCDMVETKIPEILLLMERARKELKELRSLLIDSASVFDRLEATGVLNQKTARDLAIVGVPGRASGQDRDFRRDHPHLHYAKTVFHVPVYKSGDVLARAQVRMDEVIESTRIIEQVLGRLPQGAIRVAMPQVPKNSSALGYTEGWRGPIVHSVATDTDGKIFRYKIDDPSFHNWPALVFAVQGNIVPDFPLINKSFNLSYSGNDR